MKLVRLTLLCSLLLLAAVPSYAIPCSTCVDRDCVGTPDSRTRCRFVFDPLFPTCETLSNPNCVGFVDEAAAPAMLAEWTVVSVEVSRPMEGTTAVTAPAAGAQPAVSHAAPQK